MAGFAVKALFVFSTVMFAGAKTYNLTPEDSIQRALSPSDPQAGVYDADVLATTDIWIETVTSNTPGAPYETAALYKWNAILWGTVSEQVRHTPQEIIHYFEFFATLPGLSVTQYDPEAVVIYGEFAINAGSYTFAWEDENGEKIEKLARYTFVYEKEPNSPTGWIIVDHHSSLMPDSPPTLIPAHRS